MKHIIIKKILLIFISLILIACSNKVDSGKIVFSSWGSIDEISILKPIIEEFSKRNNINVELIYIPENYFQKLHMMFASNTEPDVLFMNNFNLPVYADSKVLEPIDKYILNDKFDKLVFFNQALKSLSWKGQLYCLPRDISNLVIYYNKDIFLKKNVNIPNEDWTMEDFLKISEKLKDNNLYPFFADKRILFWLPFLWSFGGDLFTNDMKKSKLDDSKSIKALKFYTDLILKYKIAPTEKEVGNIKGAQLFSEGKLAMFLSGRWSVPTFRKTLNFNWDIINFPKGDYGSIVGIDSSGWCISRNSKNKEIAWKFIKYLASKESIINFTKNGLIVPSRKDVAYSNTFLDNQKPKNSKVFLDIIEKGKATKTNPNWNEISNEIITGLEDIWYDNKNIEEKLKTISKRINLIMY